MGCFSFLRADYCTKQANFVMGDGVKILIPQHLGGGYIKDKYFDYGYINHYHNAFYVSPNGQKTSLGDVEADLYGLLAWFNCPKQTKYIGAYPRNILEVIKRGCTHDDINRKIGIDIGCYDNQVDCLKYPLKLISPTCKDTYESCRGRSYGDPVQGFRKLTWETYEDRYASRR